ncbi:hypothetical protein NA57DRAFT_67936 [Rhizodiscina lignyota]|uniref:Fe2OG dioxygenase domain-containing protein n=1 Tax=Rhizodiscina lignyota TaxID=1504668 RepID=A0A9P4IBM1_9PEZI|nr:hypothetical protein NA57DRAFT_67936 [Rhizodiscina lignyota]
MTPQSKKSKGRAQSQPMQEQQLPNWPAFDPLIPRMDLSIEVLVPNQVVLIRNFFTSALCKKYVSFLSTLPLVTTPGKPKKGEAVRVNDRFQIDDVSFAQRLWNETALRELVTHFGDDDDLPSVGKARDLWGGDVLGLNPNIRIYRYSKGQFFDQHYDDSNHVTVNGNVPAKTTWTLLLYLTSPSTGCIGGETVFYPEPATKKKGQPIPEPIVVELETGMALLHRHGADCMLHEGREVLEGEKWIIRSDLAVRR